MKLSSGLLIIASLVVASCAKPPITRISVKVPETYSGYLHLATCVPVAQDPVVLSDSTQDGYTRACPPGDVELVVIKSTKTFVISPENVHVRRNSDGVALSISAEIPSQ